jgi:hypothetical protein
LELSDLSSETNKRRRIVNEYLDRHDASTVLVATVKRCLRDYQDAEKEHHNEEILLAMLPNHVQADLLTEVRSPILLKRSLFITISNASLSGYRHLCHAAVRPISAAKGEIVFEKGNACTRMLLVYEGSLSYGEPVIKDRSISDDEDDYPVRNISASTPVKSSHEIRQGDLISEASLFTNWINKGRLHADSLSYMFSLEVSEFAQAVVRFPDAYASVVLYARAFADQLSLEATPSDLPSFEVVARKRPRHKENTVYVQISSASGLRNADGFFMGTSDPYCVCQVRGLKKQNAHTRCKSEVVQNCIDPVWNQSFELTFRGEHEIEFQVWDRDLFPKQDELLGFAYLSYAQIAQNDGFQGALKLEGDKARGHLTVKVSAVPLEEV